VSNTPKPLVSLDKLPINQTGSVRVINAKDAAIKRRLLDMGITRGVDIKIVRVAPLGDPINIFLRGYHLILRKEDMKYIFIEVVIP
jgi:ferrous iron transport protein A